jgi:CelD/BcsL family acetyltransferase involved in cellulose biosynthesis
VLPKDLTVALTLRVCRTPEELTSLASEWRQLDEAASARSPFLTWEWLSAWWSQCRGAAEPAVVAAYDGAALVGAVPLVRRRRQYYRVPVIELSFMGDPASDRQFFLDRTPDGSATDAIWHFLLTNPLRVHLLRLEQVPEDSLTARRAAGLSHGPNVEVASRLPYIAIAADWPTYEKGLSRKFRSEMRTRPKVFEAAGPWRLEHVRGPAAAQWITRLAEVEVASHKMDGGRAFLATDAHRALLTTFAAASVPGRVECVVSLLIVNEKVEAYLYGFISDGKYHAYNMAFLPTLAKGSPGKYLMHETIRFAFEAGLREFDFLRGESYMKDKWDPALRANVRIVHFYPGLRGPLLRWLVFRLRPAIKEWREKRQKRPAAVVAPPSSPDEAGDAS